MKRAICLIPLILTGYLAPPAARGAEDDVVFRSDVSLVRVDAQVLDRGNRAITGLRQEDFVLREEGQVLQIRNFASEDTPADLLFLVDVSTSMRPHVERIAAAARDASRVMGNDDRVALMAFDRSSRVILPFQGGRGQVEAAFDQLLRRESFVGGTDITRGLYDAVRYISDHGRREARRAIVILTDDQTERNRDEEGVIAALDRAEAVLSLLLAPDAMRNRRISNGGGGGPIGWPGGGGGGPLGGVIWGRRYPPMGGGGGRGGGPVYGGTQSAGTREIARRSGGDTMDVDDAAALETTLSRLRQRYALHFYLPAGARAGQQRHIDVELAAAALRRYPGAEVRYRRTYYAPRDSGSAQPPPAPGSEPVVVTRAGEGESTPAAAGGGGGSDSPRLRRRPAVNERTGPSGPGGWRRTDEPAEATTPADTEAAPRAAPAAAPAPEADSQQPQQQPQRGWRRVKPGEIEQ